jgi:hypothetical protein
MRMRKRSVVPVRSTESLNRFNQWCPERGGPVTLAAGGQVWVAAIVARSNKGNTNH